jgi:TRAP-type uncharacterized transport system substrate-binding protein
MKHEPMTGGDNAKRPGPTYLGVKIPVISWGDLWVGLGPILVLSLAAILLVMHYVSPAPPRSLTMSTGPQGSTFESVAEKYRKILGRNGIQLKLVQSKGSLENLKRLVDRVSGVDIALVQAGLPAPGDASDLVSLGSMFYEPLTVFYRSPKPIARLSELAGQRIGVGPEGSGARYLALELLKANEIEPGGPSKLLDLEGEDARAALLHRQADAIVLAGDSASGATIREMLHAEGVRLFDFPQADAYVRRFPFLSRLLVPAGAFDLGENLPPEPVNMLAPTVELIARSELHPALCDLLIEAATEVHGRAGVLHAAGQFPNPTASTFPLSAEAARYYKTGSRSFAYRYLPFWLATLVNRALIALVPILVVVIPGLKLLPQLYAWRVKSRIHQRYGELMALERESLAAPAPERRAILLERLEHIERAVIARRMPGAFADQLYILREHIGFVRDQLMRAAAPSAGAAPSSSAQAGAAEKRV